MASVGPGVCPLTTPTGRLVETARLSTTGTWPNSFEPAATSIGANAIVLDGALVESNAIVEPGAVVPPGRRIPTGQVWGGNPAVYVRDVQEDEMVGIQKQADYYAEVGNKHATEFLPYGSAYLDEGTLEGLPVGVAKE